MRVKLKNVIGGAFLSLAILAAGGANALVISEPNGVEAGAILIPAGDPLNAWAGTRLCESEGCGVGLGSVVSNGGDTVVVGVVDGFGAPGVATWNSDPNDFVDVPGEIETFMCDNVGGLCLSRGQLVPSSVLTIVTNLEVAGVPEPASLVLLGSALVGFGLIRRRRKA